jgi:hypothetical protein
MTTIMKDDMIFCEKFNVEEGFIYFTILRWRIWLDIILFVNLLMLSLYVLV